MGEGRSCLRRGGGGLEYACPSQCPTRFVLIRRLPIPPLLAPSSCIQVKSPEMRSVAGVSAAYLAARDVDRRRRVGAGTASDVWSLGCLLFELLTEQVLFPSNEEASAESHARVTGTGPVLTQDQHQALHDVWGGGPGPGEATTLLLHAMLQRDPGRRPDLRSLLHTIDTCIAAC